MTRLSCKVMELYNATYDKNFDTKLWWSYANKTPYIFNFWYIAMQIIKYRKN